MIMEDAFFKAVKANKLGKAKEIYENNLINVMYNDNCVMQHVVKTRKMDAIKWLLQIEDFTEFAIQEEPMSHFISVMTLACREKYYDLMVYLHENYAVMTWMDFGEFLQGCRDVELVRKVLENVHTPESHNDESLGCAATFEIIDLLLEHEYTIHPEIVEMCDNPLFIRYAIQRDYMSSSARVENLFVRSALLNNVDIMKCIIEEYPDMRYIQHEWKVTMYNHFEMDQIDTMQYIDDLGYGIETFSSETQETIITKAMRSQAVKCVRYFYSKVGVKPTSYIDTYIQFDYTKLAADFFDVQFSPKHLMCFDKKLFKFILKRTNIDEYNIDTCLKSVLVTDSNDNLEVFLNHVDTLSPGIVRREHYGNIFVWCCVSNYQCIAEDIIRKHGYVLADATITKNDLNDEFPGVVHLTENVPINTPKRLLHLMLHDDDAVNILSWISKVYNIQFKYRHICSALDDTYGVNPKMILFLLQNTGDLSFNQLKHVFSGIISHYENNAYYTCKYLMKRYEHLMTPHLKSVLFKHSMAFTQQAFRLFEDCEYSVRTCLMQAIYGDNLIAFDYLLDKHEYRIRQKNDELFRYACSTESSLIVKRMCDIWKDIYSFKTESDDELVPLIKDSLEYFVHNGDVDNVLKKLTKKRRGDESFECAVCYESANIQTTCKHTYCVTCISKWYIKNHTCPMCKQKFNIKKCLHLV